MKSFRIAVILIVAALAAPSAFAQSRGNARLSGKVVDEQGQPVIDVVVRAQMAGQTEAFPGKTDKKGEWRINGLADGQWNIELSKDGLEPVRQTIEIRDERSAPLNVTMKKPAPAVDPSIAINAELQRAVGLAQGGKFAEARQICEELLAKNPTLNQCYGFIGRMYAAENQPAKALESVKVALEKDPNNVDMKLLLADLMIETGDKVEGRKMLASIDMTQVKDPYPFMNAAITMINEGKGAEAVDWLTKLLAQFPTQNEIYYYRGRAYLAASKFDEAKADLEKFLTLSPTSKEATDAKKILEQMVKK